MAGGKKTLPKYSVLMSVYKNEKPSNFADSLASVFNQTAPCDELVLVEDGPLTKELYKTIDNYKKIYPGIIKEIKNRKNVGLGLSLRRGIVKCKNELIARFDSDDISAKNRCEKQLVEFVRDKKLDIIGSSHIEFVDSIEKKETYSYKDLPRTDSEIKEYAKRRNPFSHSAVIFKKTAVLKAGNYNNRQLIEDYDLWVRMIRNGATCKNLGEYLNYVKVDKDLYKRRGGIKYERTIKDFRKELLKNGFCDRRDYYVGTVAHGMICLMPNRLREIVYKRFLRG